MADRFTQNKFHWLNTVCADPLVSSASFRFAFALSGFWNRKTGDAWPAFPTIAKQMACGPRNAQDLIAGLVSAGHITVERGRGRNKSNRYHFVFKTPENTQTSACFNEAENTKASSYSKDSENTQTSAIKHADMAYENTKTSAVKQYEEQLKEQVEGKTRKKQTSSRNRKLSSMPSPWPDEKDLEWAVKYWTDKGRAELVDSVEEISARARDHHLKEAKKSADWAASWRTWAMNEIRFNKPSTGSSSGGVKSASDGAMRAMGLINGDG